MRKIYRIKSDPYGYIIFEDKEIISHFGHRDDATVFKTPAECVKIIDNHEKILGMNLEIEFEWVNGASYHNIQKARLFYGQPRIRAPLSAQPSAPIP